MLAACVIAVLGAGSARADLVATADTAGSGVGQVSLEGGATLVGGVLTFPDGGDGAHLARINGFPGFSFNQNWSMAFWVQNDLGFDRDMIAFQADKFIVRTDEGDGGATRFRIDADGGDLVPGTVTNIADTGWHHLGIVHDNTGGSVEFFVDGTSQGATGLSDWNLTTGSVYLGGIPGSKNDMAGQMQGVGFYNEALAAADFAGLTLGQRPAGSPVQPSPGIAYAAPAGGWTYAYTGDGDIAPEDGGDDGPFAALDGTWDHDNGSDEWDGSPIGSGRPGGAMSLTEDSTTYLQIQDTGNPTDHGHGDPGSNRKVFFGHNMSADGASNTILDDGVTMSMRMRVPTSGLDDVNPNGGGGTSPWPAEGKGYGIHDGGKGFGIHQADGGTIGFHLSLGNDGYSHGQSGLVMNHLNGTSVTGDVDSGEAGTENVLALDDPTQWHEFWITIEDGGAGTHRVTIYRDGSLSGDSFDVTAGSGSDYDASYLAMELGSTGFFGAVDVDFIAWTAGVHAPVPEPSMFALAALALFGAGGFRIRNRRIG